MRADGNSNHEVCQCCFRSFCITMRHNFFERFWSTIIEHAQVIIPSNKYIWHLVFQRIIFRFPLNIVLKCPIKPYPNHLKESIHRGKNDLYPKENDMIPVRWGCKVEKLSMFSEFFVGFVCSRLAREWQALLAWSFLWFQMFPVPVARNALLLK